MNSTILQRIEKEKQEIERISIQRRQMTKVNLKTKRSNILTVQKVGNVIESKAIKQPTDLP